MLSLRQPFYGSYPITLDFGEECFPLYKAGQHMGIDYGCPLGTKILASADGIVTTVGEMPAGYGKYVVLRHGNGKYETLYAHLSQVLVKEWQTVECGEVIALSGSTGKSTGPHLHFELIEWGRKIDAKPYLKCVLDDKVDNSTPSTEKPKFDTVRVGKCVVVCDGANARCHCDMSRVNCSRISAMPLFKYSMMLTRFRSTSFLFKQFSLELDINTYCPYLVVTGVVG